MSPIIILIAVSLSMDAFSLSLAYGTLNINKKSIYTLSTIVAIYHFIMPILGINIGKIIMDILPVKPTTIVFIVLLFIGIQMIIETLKKEESVKLLTQAEMLLFGLAVSIDSFSVGISLNTITNQHIISAIIFSITSFIFTFLGLSIGKKVNNIIGKISTLLGGIMLIIIGISYTI